MSKKYAVTKSDGDALGLYNTLSDLLNGIDDDKGSLYVYDADGVRLDNERLVLTFRLEDYKVVEVEM